MAALRSGREAMTMQVSRESVRREVLEWIDSMLSSKSFGAFSIEIKMHEGHPVSVEKMERVHYVKRADAYERQ
jgi:hypothetical protein